MAELLGRVEHLATTATGQQQIAGQAQVLPSSSLVFPPPRLDPLDLQAGSAVPVDVARIQDINRVINSNTDMTRTIQSFA